VIQRRRRSDRPFVPVASMGDIAFLLIIFFVLTTNFVKEKHIQLDPPESPQIDIVKESTVSVSVDENGEIWLQGKVTNPDLLENEVSYLIEGKEDKAVMVKIHKDLPQSAYGPVIKALSAAGVEILLVGVQIKK